MCKGFLYKVIAGALISSSSLAAAGQIIPPPPTPILNVSTIPGSGDQNPAGVAFVPDQFPKGGTLNPGDILVSNFNNHANFQATGSTIVRIPQSGGPASVFFQGPVGEVGLTAALAVLPQGFVVVGSTPSEDGGTCGMGHVGTGGLLIIDRNGNEVQNISDNNLMDGPWDMAFSEQGTHVLLFVSNIGTATITRVDLKAQQSGKFTVESLTLIASGYSGDCDKQTFVMGISGLAYDASKDVLYAASTEDNSIFAIPNASTTTDQGPGTLIYRDNIHLHSPVGLLLAPNGDLITSNDDALPINPNPSQPSEIVEFTPAGQFVSQFSIDPGLHAAFGIAVTQSSGNILFAAVNKNTNSVELWQEP